MERERERGGRGPRCVPMEIVEVSRIGNRTGGVHTGDTATPVPVTVYGPESIGHRGRRKASIGGGRGPPSVRSDPVVSVRGLDSKSSLEPGGISRCTSNPRFSRLVFFFFFAAQKSFEREGESKEET